VVLPCFGVHQLHVGHTGSRCFSAMLVWAAQRLVHSHGLGPSCRVKTQAAVEAGIVSWYMMARAVPEG
jgi:hypothetical protein